MKTTHTPGPWKIVPRTSPKGTLMVESQHGLIACMESSKTRPVTYEKAEANAKLIAAAPDLAEFAKCYLSVFENHNITNNSHPCYDWTGHLADKARAAIAKAAGEHQ
jgi:hypothetical protein